MKEFKVNPTELLSKMGLVTNAIQDALINSSARFKIFRAGRRVGKSYTAAKDLFCKEVLVPNTRSWIVGPSYSLAEKEFRYVAEFLVKAQKGLGLPVSLIRSNPKAGDLYIKTGWGSEVIGMSADTQSTLVGEEIDCLIMSETAQHKEATWEKYLRATLTTRKGRAIFPTTPDVSGLWLYELELEAAKLPDWETFKCAAWDCPHWDKEEIENLRRTLSEDAFYEQIGGEWRFYTGRVYKAFKIDVHCIRSFPIPSGWVIREGIDFGVRDATAVIWLAESPTGEFYAFDEYYAQDRPTVTHAKDIKLIEAKYSPVRVRIADFHALGKQLMSDLSILGLHSVNCIHDVKARRDRFQVFLGINDLQKPYHIREKLVEDSFPNTVKYPKFYIFKDKCPNLIKELLFLRWKEGTRKEGTYGDTIGDDHAVAATEYCLAYATRARAGSGKKKVRYVPRMVNRLTGY